MMKPTLDDLVRKYADKPKVVEKFEIVRPVADKSPSSSGNSLLHPDIFVSLMFFVGVAMFGAVSTVAFGELEKARNAESQVLGATITIESENDLTTPEIGEKVMKRYAVTSFNEKSDLAKELADATNRLGGEFGEIKEDESVIRVQVSDVEGGYVNYRNFPDGGVVGRVASGEIYEVASAQSIGDYEWIELQIAESTTGWIRSDLVENL